MLFSAWQAITQALQPVQADRSITMPHAPEASPIQGVAVERMA
jgi:hypothetical protein